MLILIGAPFSHLNLYFLYRMDVRNSYNVAPNGTANSNGPSADNVPIVSSTPGTPVTIASISNGSTGIAYNVAASLLPQVTGDYVYRFTFNGYVNVGTVPTAGNIVFYVVGVKSDTTTYLLTAQTVWLRAAGILSFASLSAEFFPAAGDSIRILILNDTGSTLSNVQVVPTEKGCAISLVSKSATKQLIFS